MTNPIPNTSKLDKVYNVLHHPAAQLPLYGALAAGDIEAGLEERKKGKSGILPFAGAGALGLMAAPYVIDLARSVKGMKAASDRKIVSSLKSIL